MKNLKDITNILVIISSHRISICIFELAFLRETRAILKYSQKKFKVILFTAFILMEPQGQGTKYTAIAVHPDEESKKRHEEMGFHDGWGTALDQLVEYAKTI